MPDMASDDFSAMLEKITALPVSTLDIIGGEPTLHPHIVGFVREAVQRGLNVNISSNGTNTAVLEELYRAGNSVTIGISINDRESLEHSAEFIQKHKVVVKSIYHPTMDDALIREIFSLRPKAFYVIYRDALARNALHATIPFYQFVSAVDEWLHPQAGMVYCSGFLPDRAQYPELEQVRCPAGTTKLGIMPDGSVYPCNFFFGRPEFRLGNILMDPFERIWNDARLGFFRTFSQSTCRRETCSLYNTCHGGCPAHSLIHGDDLSAPDPRCAVPPSPTAIPQKF